jgi:hypothetical protein
MGRSDTPTDMGSSAIALDASKPSFMGVKIPLLAFKQES